MKMENQPLPFSFYKTDYRINAYVFFLFFQSCHLETNRQLGLETTFQDCFKLKLAQ